MISVKIDNQKLEFFERCSVNLTYDKPASTFELSTVFDTDNEFFYELFRPKQFRKIEIFTDDILILTGTILNHSINSDSTTRNVTISGYSTCGKVNDCSIPSTVNMQFDGMNLLAIANRVCSALGIEVQVNANAYEKASEVYETAQGEPADRAGYFISRLASQKNIVTGNTETGRLLLTKIRLNEGFAGNYREGFDGIISITGSVNGQQMHSDITVINQSNFDDSNKTSFSRKTDIPIFRPVTVVQADGNINDGQEAVNAVINNEQKAERYSFSLPTHFYQNGEVIKPNREILIESRSAYIEEKTKMFVENVTLTSDTKKGDQAFITVIPSKLMR